MVCYYSDKGDFILVFDDQVYQSYPADAVLRCVMSKLCPKWQQPQLAVGELFLQGEGFFRKENQVAPEFQNVTYVEKLGNLSVFSV